MKHINPEPHSTPPAQQLSDCGCYAEGFGQSYNPETFGEVYVNKVAVWECKTHAQVVE